MLKSVLTRLMENLVDSGFDIPFLWSVVKAV